ncbi:MAG: hypothetical protein II551_01770, partial [Paludibacteraceae bacterium]|nr:hypothetical protein [Paludibacteraceae bacterium]
TFAFPIRKRTFLIEYIPPFLSFRIGGMYSIKRTFLIEYIPPIRKDKKGGQEKGTEGSPIYGRYKGGKCSFLQNNLHRCEKSRNFASGNKKRIKAEMKKRIKAIIKKATKAE